MNTSHVDCIQRSINNSSLPRLKVCLFLVSAQKVSDFASSHPYLIHWLEGLNSHLEVLIPEWSHFQCFSSLLYWSTTLVLFQLLPMKSSPPILWQCRKQMDRRLVQDQYRNWWRFYYQRSKTSRKKKPDWKINGKILISFTTNSVKWL